MNGIMMIYFIKRFGNPASNDNTKNKAKSQSLFSKWWNECHKGFKKIEPAAIPLHFESWALSWMVATTIRRELLINGEIFIMT